VTFGTEAVTSDQEDELLVDPLVRLPLFVLLAPIFPKNDAFHDEPINLAGFDR
jgi:hypothetical protein